MPSWQARIANGAVRLLVRRADWGDERALVRRARRLFGAPRPYQWLRTRAVRIDQVREPSVRGEWLATREPGRGAILYIHGGGYVACSPATHRPITAGLARRTRRRVFSVDYRLAPEHRFPIALDDVEAAYRWLLTRDIAPREVAIVGDSAGGGLALALMVRARDAGLPLPSCAICFSPWADLQGTGDSIRANDGRCAMFRPDNGRDFAAAYLGGAPASEPHASPLFANLAGLPPVLLQVGSTELLLDDARRVHDKIQRAGGMSRLEVFDDVHHGWQMLAGLVPEADTALRQAVDFIRQHP